MAPAISTVEAALLYTQKPSLIAQLAHRALIQAHVAAPSTGTLAGKTRKVGFTDHGHPKSAIQQVIPRVKLRQRKIIAAGEEIDQPARRINNCFLGPDAIHRRYVVIWQFGGIHYHPAPAMGVSGQ